MDFNLSKLEIRKGDKKDLNEISNLFKEEFGKKPYYEKWTNKTSLMKIKYYFKSHYFLVAEYDKKLVGFIIFHDFIWYDGYRGFIDELVVSSKFQNKGIGTKLILAAENNFKKRKVTNMSFYANKSSRSIKLYKRLNCKEGGMVLFEKKI